VHIAPEVKEYWRTSSEQDALLDRRHTGARLFGYSGTTREVFRLTFPVMILFGFWEERRDKRGSCNNEIYGDLIFRANSILFTQIWLPARPHCFSHFTWLEMCVSIALYAFVSFYFFFQRWKMYVVVSNIVHIEIRLSN